MLQNYRLRPALGEQAFSGGPPTAAPGSAPASRACSTRRWRRPSSTPGSRPPSSGSSSRSAAPTIDYTVHFRSPLPPPGATPEDPYLIAFNSGLARHGFFEEDGELWSADGVLLAQSRLACSTPLRRLGQADQRRREPVALLTTNRDPMRG